MLKITAIEHEVTAEQVMQMLKIIAIECEDAAEQVKQILRISAIEREVTVRLLWLIFSKYLGSFHL
jgi:hypothetical protein